jgi:hypothetical protein
MIYLFNKKENILINDMSDIKEDEYLTLIDEFKPEYIKIIDAGNCDILKLFCGELIAYRFGLEENSKQYGFNYYTKYEEDMFFF